MTGGNSAGVAAIWIATAPDYLPLPSFGVVQLSRTQAAPFTMTTLDADGAAVLPLAEPALPELAGQAFWWQAVSTVANAPWLALRDGVRREVRADAGS